MISLWDQVRDGDGQAVRRALREADLIWRKGEQLEDAVVWVERAAAMAQESGDEARAIELATCAIELGREAKRRSGMPARSDPAWAEARRIQSSLIEVQDSWLIPVDELDEPDTTRMPAEVLPDDELASIDIEWDMTSVTDARQTLPDLGSAIRAREMMASGIEDVWFEEAPTLPRTTVPANESSTAGSPLRSMQALERALDRVMGPDVIVVPTGADVDGIATVRETLRRTAELEDTSQGVIDALVDAGSTLWLNEDGSLAGWDAGVVVEGEIALLRQGRVSHRIGAGESFSCTASIGGVTMHIAATRADTRVVAWDRDTIESVLSTSPWVLESLRLRADYLATLSVIPLENVARQMSQSLVSSLLQASRVVVVPPHAVLVDEGMEVHALNIVGAGQIVLIDEAQQRERAQPGQILFPGELVEGAPAPATARAGALGATLLHVEAVELARFLPHVPLLERALRHR